MAKLSNERMLEDIQKLGEIANRELPVKASYAIAKNISKIEAELKVYDKERKKLIEKYAEKDDKGNVKSDEHGNVVFKEDCKEQWNRDIKELLAIENDIDINKFNINELDGYKMTPAELMLIDYMIEE